eukprot:83938_1
MVHFMMMKIKNVFIKLMQNIMEKVVKKMVLEPDIKQKEKVYILLQLMKTKKTQKRMIVMVQTIQSKKKRKIQVFGGDKYLTSKIMETNNGYSRFSVGFGGGCAQNEVGSKGGNGGGKIIILCNELILKDEGKITSNGGDGFKSGGGGSG